MKEMAKIVGVSHIIHSGFDALALPKSYEFAYEESPAWPQEKRKFLRQEPVMHNLTFWRSSRDVGIERVIHSRETRNITGPFRLIICADTKGGVNDITSESAMEALQTPTATIAKVDEGFNFVAAEALEPNRCAVALHTSNVEKTSKFWQKHLNFVFISESPSPGKWQLIGLNSPFSKLKLQLLIIKAPTTPYFLDDQGWTSLALQVTSVDGCRGQLLHNGIETSESFKFFVGGRNFKLAFFRSPTGEIIELCEAVSS